eukprot:scaffold410328_cov19-Prasinocladus_malaysianus.AAC.1
MCKADFPFMFKTSDELVEPSSGGPTGFSSADHHQELKKASRPDETAAATPEQSAVRESLQDLLAVLADPSLLCTPTSAQDEAGSSSAQRLRSSLL